MRFVKRVLMLRGGSDIKKFDINLDFHFEKLAKHLDLWILAASRRNVEELNIIHWYGIDVRLPRCLVTSESLTGLVLRFEGSLVLPDTMGLPRLKSLVLVSIEVEDLEFINKLLSSCPVLETLRIQQIRAKAGDELCVSNSGLKHLDINHYYYGEGEPRIIRLCTPSLTSFICEDYMIRDYCLENLSSLVTADIKMTQVEDEDIGKAEPFPKGILVFLKAFHNVRKLTLSLDFFQ
ncbi:hypothetical protein MKW94_026709, partial [Papaver nudicaule]|nr:hypothetical protein [Papaver nudicaule]